MTTHDYDQVDRDTGVRRWARAWTVRAVGDQSGTATLETAILAPVLIGVLFGIVQFGALFFLHTNMVNAAREAARQAAVGAVTLDGAETMARDYLANWGLGFDVRATLPAGSNATRVAISVPMREAMLVDVLGLFATNPTLSAEAAIRME